MKQLNKIIYGLVSKTGKFIPDNEDDFRNEFLRLSGKMVEVVVRQMRNKRSNNQNRYLWGVCYKLISEETGYEKNKLHEMFKQMFLDEIILINGKEYHTVKGSSELDTIDFSDEFVEKIRLWAAQEINCYIPDPNEVDIN